MYVCIYLYVYMYICKHKRFVSNLKKMPKLCYTKVYISAYKRKLYICMCVNMFAGIYSYTYICACTNNNHHNTFAIFLFHSHSQTPHCMSFPSNSPQPPTRKSKLLAALCRATNRRPLCIHWLRRAACCAIQDQKRNTSMTNARKAVCMNASSRSEQRLCKRLSPTPTHKARTHTLHCVLALCMVCMLYGMLLV